MQFSDNPDFLFYSNFGSDFLKYNDCVRICFSGEPIVSNFNDCDYAIDYFRMNYGDRHFRAGGILASVGKGIDKSIQNRSEATQDKLSRRFCNFIYSNENKGNGSKLRKEFCRQLGNYKHIDCPGKVLNNMQYNTAIKRRYEFTDSLTQNVANEKWADSKIDFIGNYKFTIAFENTSMNGYATEKILHPFIAYSVPIYWGAPDVAIDFNSGAFINCSEYDNDLSKVMERVIELDKDDEQYINMLRQQPMNSSYSFKEDEELSEYLYNIVRKGNNPFEKNALGFINASSTNFVEHCRLGHVGMRTIARASTGWLKYKIENIDR